MSFSGLGIDTETGIKISWTFWFLFRPLSYSQEPNPFSNTSAFSLLIMISQSLGACWHSWIQDFSHASRHRVEAFLPYSTYAWECEAGVRVINAFAKVDVFPLGSHRGYTLPNMELFASGNGEVERRRRRRRKTNKLIPPGCLRAGAPNHFPPWPGIQTLESLQPRNPKPGMPTAGVMVAK